MNTVIAPTDFSDVSLNAVYYAADMAAGLNLGLLVLHATESDVLRFSAEDGAASDVEEKFLQLKQTLIKRNGSSLKMRFKQVPGIIENELATLCERRHPFAVVMATHGANTRQHFFMESITVHLSRHLQYPVIIVPGNIQYKPVKKIVLATDLRDIDKLPADKILAVVKAFNARLHVLHIAGSEAGTVHGNIPEVEAIKAKLQQAAPSFHVLKCNNVHQGILCFAENNNADIIITFPRKHTFFHKSESKQVIFNSPVTVMTVQ